LGLVVLLTLMIVPSSAAAPPSTKVIFRANGKVTNYSGYDPFGINTIVGGNWKINVKDGKVDFKLFYKESNIFEGQYADPKTEDHFTMTLVTLEYVDAVPGQYCFIYGHFNMDKLAWKLEGSTPRLTHIPNYFGDIEGWVYIDAGSMHVDVWPWYLDGSTISMTIK